MCLSLCISVRGTVCSAPVCVLHASLGWGFFPFVFFVFFTPVEMRNLFYVEKTSRMALDVDQM